jgi:hypothetical protein
MPKAMGRHPVAAKAAAGHRHCFRKTQAATLQGPSPIGLRTFECQGKALCAYRNRISYERSCKEILELNGDSPEIV